ncbi:HD-domain/PDEase-like protein [Parathielavia hyrcaniae]|uniref:Phosphodiesterase n=1 Tax=Parathielavia hyrcaniae TaxID=113614 RepID=A0AAN6T6U1_9PEZI|nr:HD-domain/PDEase-like protein [Parathielavia hyrcaniae]
MENVACNVIYVDRSVSQDRDVRAGQQNSDREGVPWESSRIAENVGQLLDVFDSVHLCSTGGACLAQWLNLHESSAMDLKPTVFILDTPYQDLDTEPLRLRAPSPLPLVDDEGDHREDELYGLALLRRIISESYVRNASKLVVTIPIIAYPSPGQLGENSASEGRASSAEDRRAANKRMLRKCLDLGATDVMANPINAKCVTNLEVHAYRAHLDAARDQKALIELRRGRKRSWVGISEEKPFAYLREAMVSKLMGWICRIGSETEDVLGSVKLSISVEKQAEVTSAVGQWHFCAHSFTDDELVVAALAMFNHALSIPELEPWRIPTDQLHRFLLACRAAYNTFVPYHNFRHVVDVLQATFHFLVRIGSLPPYRSANGVLSGDPKSPMAKLLLPFEALTLLITAIGHDVGHPGVNNGFLVTLNAPLAQLYNDRSVLESFHCAAYSQILRRYWPSVFCDSKMRSLMISSILATDMGLHFDYMRKMGQLQDRLRADGRTEDWEECAKNEQKALTCALLIKCADISNVTRRHDTARQWMRILADEFSRQATMENELAIKTSLMSEPKKDVISLSTAQLKFMTLFALPLFQGVADILPAMQYCVDELLLNKDQFEKWLREEQERQPIAEPVSGLDDIAVLPNTIASTTSPDPPTETHPARGCVPKVVEPQILDAATVEENDLFQMPHPSLKRPTDGGMVNGIVTSFPSEPEFSRGEQFSSERSHHHGHSRQKYSETTESSSAPASGDWGSHSTSATTGRMPLSPSTQGTSIVSRDSFDRPHSYSTSVPVPSVVSPDESTTTVPDYTTTATTTTTTTTPTATTKSRPETRVDSYPSPLALDDEQHDTARNGHHQCASCAAAKKNGATLEPVDPAGRQLKKKPSRFRINGLQSLFRKHKSSSPPMQAADTAG